MNDLISVIVPVYKVEQWLNDCIESIVKQTYKNLEIIIVDDGSPDNCPSICNEWAKKDNRIRVIHKENGGLSSARNAGLDIISGEYISFVDSDDYIHPDMYKVMLEDIKRTEADVVRCSYYVDVQGKVTQRSVLDEQKTYLSEDILNCYFYHKEDFCSGVWDKLFKAELFKNVRFPNGLNSEDYYVYAIVYNNIEKLFYNNIPLYYYRIRENSICNTPYIYEHSFDKIIVCDKVYDYVKDNYEERIKDAEMFQAIARFSTYYETMKLEHSISMEKEWKKILKNKLKSVLKNQKVSIAFKMKYLIMSLNPKLYMKIKREL